MSNPIRYSSKVLKFALALAALGAYSIAIWGQEASAIKLGNARLPGLPDDWTHHHVVFSNPGTADDAIRKGNYEEWFTIVNDPRYVVQQLKRGLPVQGPAADDVARFEDAWRAARDSAEAKGVRDPWERVRRPFREPTLENDWSMVLGSGAAGVGAGMYPAKFAFNQAGLGTANCASAANPDYVVYNTGAAGSATQASVVAYDNLYSSCTGPVPSVYWAFNTGGTVVTSVVLSTNGKQLAFVQTPSSGNAQLVLLTWAAMPAGRNVTATYTSTASTAFTVASGTPLTSMDVGAAISGTGLPTPEYIATVTSATAGTLTADPTHTESGMTAAVSADAGGPDTSTGTLSVVSNASYYGCPTPCMTSISFNGTSRTDTISSPFYDYSGDILYVGDAQGYLHKFHPVFAAAPAEVTSGGWPAHVSSTTSPALTSPVYDSGATGDVFVGDEFGYLYSVSKTGGVASSLQLGTVNGTTPAMVDGPLLDSTNGKLFAFVSDDTTTSSSSYCDSAGCSAVVEVGTTAGSGTGDFGADFAESVIGVANTNPMYAGAFDNLYWTSNSGNGGTGNLYVEASTGGGSPKLIAVPLSGEAIQAQATGGGCPTGHAGPANSSNTQCANNIANPITSGTAKPSPVTEFLSGSTDYIYASVTTAANLTASGPDKCSGATQACLYSWNTTSALTGTTVPSDGFAAAGGTSGIIIDNSATGGGSQVYYSTLSSGTCSTSGSVTSGACAVQAAQGTL
jgi:hypothetical protein